MFDGYKGREIAAIQDILVRQAVGEDDKTRSIYISVQHSRFSIFGVYVDIETKSQRVRFVNKVRSY